MDIRKFFHRKKLAQKQPQSEPQTLRIEGIGPAPLTPEPDEAELAAQALLEHMTEVSSFKVQGSSKKIKDKAQQLPAHSRGGAGVGSQPETRDAKYYRDLAARIRSAHEAATQRTLRFVAFCEQELQKPSLPLSGPGSLGLLEAELYKRLDVIERRGGELKRRWQHCLATVIVRMMKAKRNENPD